MIRTLTVAAMLSTAVATAAAQTGTVTFGGPSNNSVPTVDYGAGPALSFSSRVLSGFGDQANVGSADARWWTTQYSGQGMVYGNNSSSGNVLEVRLEAASGFNLFLGSALFGGYLNTARHVSYQLFSDDYAQSTALTTVLTGSTAPVTALFGAIGLNNAVRLQFTETDAAGVSSGRGAYDVGIQDIAYSVRRRSVPPSKSVPEPEAFVLLATVMAFLGVGLRRQQLASRS